MLGDWAWGARGLGKQRAPLLHLQPSSTAKPARNPEALRKKQLSWHRTFWNRTLTFQVQNVPPGDVLKCGLLLLISAFFFCLEIIVQVCEYQRKWEALHHLELELQKNSCELLNLSAGTPALVLCKSNICS